MTRTTILLLALVTSTVALAEDAGDAGRARTAKELTGIDVDAGKPLFAFAKKQAFLLGALEGAVIHCGVSVSQGRHEGFVALVRSFDKAEGDQISELVQAGIRFGVRSSKTKEASACMGVMKAYKGLDGQLATDFSR